MTDVEEQIPPADDVADSKQSTLPTTSSAWDVDGDGVLDDAELALMKMDKKGTGNLTKDEMYKLMQEHLSTKKNLLKSRKVIGGLAIVIFILTLSNFATSFAAAALAKDTTTQNGSLVDAHTGNALSTQTETENFVLEPGSNAARFLQGNPDNGNNGNTKCNGNANNGNANSEEDTLEADVLPLEGTIEAFASKTLEIQSYIEGYAGDAVAYVLPVNEAKKMINDCRAGKSVNFIQNIQNHQISHPLCPGSTAVYNDPSGDSPSASFDKGGGRKISLKKDATLNEFSVELSRELIVEAVAQVADFLPAC